MIKPILFNTEMVQAILEGRKSTTRRINKDVYDIQYSDIYKDTNVYGSKMKCTSLTMDQYVKEYSKFQVGDILYVRETWQEIKNIYNSRHYIYKASPDIVPEHCYYVTNGIWDSDLKWKPSIFMPKEAARIFLKVTGVRVERLQDIDYEGYKAEGIKAGYDGWLKEWNDLWNSTINKKDIDKYGWNANPYVWVIEFQRVERPKDFIEGGDKE